MMASQKQPNTDRAAVDVRTFANLIAATRRAGRPGLWTVAVNLRPLESSMELQLVRDALLEKISRWAKDKEAKYYNVEARAIFVMSRQSETDILQATSDIRTYVGYLVGPRAREIDLEIGDLVRVLHTGRDIKIISEFLRSYVQVPTIFDRPIDPEGDLSTDHLWELRNRIRSGTPAAFVREFGRNQPLARLNDQGDPVAVGAERFISMQHLRSTLLSKISFPQGAVDFDRVGRELDRAVLDAVAGEDPAQFGHVTVNLTVDTFLSDYFSQYARDFSVRVDDVELWVEVPIEQVLAHLGAFRTRQRELREFRVFTMADRVRPEMLSRMEKTDLDFEGYKLPADPENITLQDLRAPVERLLARRARVVITRIEHPEQLAAASSMRVRHVQGYLIDRLLAQLEIYE